MSKKLKYSVIAGSLGNVGDRYTLGGYKPEKQKFSDRLAELSKLNLLDGVEIFAGNLEGMEIGDFSDMVKSHDLAVSAVGIDLSGDPKWRFGSLISKNPDIRAEAIAVCQKAVDIAKGVGCGLANIWLAQDGFDYPFQVDYAEQWEYMVDSVRKIADHDPSVKIALEPKSREPRNRCFIESVPTAILIAEETGRANVGVTVDVGHALVDFRNMAQAVITAARKNKFFHLHINDNYGGWDDDMIVGSVRHVEFMELFYYLRKIGYTGWCAVDIFPYRESSLRAVEESMAYMEKFEELVDGMGHEEMAACIHGDEAAASIRLLRKTMFK